MIYLVTEYKINSFQYIYGAVVPFTLILEDIPPIEPVADKVMVYVVFAVNPVIVYGDPVNVCILTNGLMHTV